ARDVVSGGAREELHILRQIAEVRTERVARPLRNVGAVQSDHAVDWLPHAEYEPGERRLAGRARADEAHRFPGGNLERHPADDRVVRAAEPERHALES